MVSTANRKFRLFILPYLYSACVVSETASPIAEPNDTNSVGHEAFGEKVFCMQFLHSNNGSSAIFMPYSVRQCLVIKMGTFFAVTPT